MGLCIWGKIGDNRRKFKFISVFFCALSILCLCPIGTVRAENRTKTVRAAYDIWPAIRRVKKAKINGWEYEYIYGSFYDLLTKLEKDEVDLMDQLSYSDERADAQMHAAKSRYYSSNGVDRRK